LERAKKSLSRLETSLPSPKVSLRSSPDSLPVRHRELGRNPLQQLDKTAPESSDLLAIRKTFPAKFPAGRECACPPDLRLFRTLFDFGGG
jgi:hypothetical protein